MRKDTKISSFGYKSPRFVLTLLAVTVLSGTALVDSNGNNGITQAWADTIEGTEGPDRIVGTPEDDVINSKGGSDANYGDATTADVEDASGDDVIISGEGNDKNNGDTAEGSGSGDDVIISGEGRDINIGDTEMLGCGTGDDVIISGEGDDFNNGDTGSRGHCGTGDDVIISGEGNDRNIGDVQSRAGSGNDAIVSGEGDDLLAGGGGRDIFICGEGQDRVTDYNEQEGDIITPDCENV